MKYDKILLEGRSIADISDRGFSLRQIVALLGAHTLGEATPANSGFRGPWAPPRTSFDNRYYTGLRNAPWTQITVQGGNNQWVSGAAGAQNLMLNVDMSLYRNVSYDPNGKATNPACVVAASACPFASFGAAIVDEYAGNANAWMADFGPSMDLMLNNGVTGLVTASGSSAAALTAPGAATTAPGAATTKPAANTTPAAPAPSAGVYTTAPLFTLLSLVAAVILSM